MAKKKKEPMLVENSGEMMLEETTGDSMMLEETSTDVILEETTTFPKTKTEKEDKLKARETEKNAEEATKRKAERDVKRKADEEAQRWAEALENQKAKEEEEGRRKPREAKENNNRERARKINYVWKVIGLHIAGFLLVAVFDYIFCLFDSDSGFSWKMTLFIFLFFAVIGDYFFFNEERKVGHVFQSILHFSLGTLWLLIGGIWLWMWIKS